MQDQIRPNIAKLSATLAADNARVFCFVGSLVQRLDNLVEAVGRADWAEVHRISDFIARSSAAVGHSEVSEAATQVCQATHHPINENELRKTVLVLMSPCGRE